MTGRSLYTKLQSFGDLNVAESSVVSWIDIAQKEVSAEFPSKASVTVTNVVVGTVSTVPTGIIKIVSVTDSTGEYSLTDVSVTNTSITFLKASSSVTVNYLTNCPDYTSLDDEMFIHPSFHSHIFFFLISMYYDKEGEGDSEESGMAERYYQRWIYYKNLTIGNLSSSDIAPEIKDPVETTDMLPRSRTKRQGVDYFEW
jgi:hypothetical protein